MKPQIEFKHVLGELSVNRNDPCEIIRELISNSYDAKAKNIFYIPLKDRKGMIFLDDGTGLDTENKVNDITPWEAFFSIGKSTKKKGTSIGYKCQGSKLCFASGRILVATTNGSQIGTWFYKIVDNPRNNLDTTYDVTPIESNDIGSIIEKFFSNSDSSTADAIKYLKKQLIGLKSSSGSLIIIDDLDTENFGKYFSLGTNPEQSYIWNYINLYTRHGDVRYLTEEQGFSASQRAQVSVSITAATLTVFSDNKPLKIPFGYPYLAVTKSDLNIKTPVQVARLRDGRFYSRSAKSFSVAGEKFSIILAIDGNRRAHDEYKNLARKGKGMSGIRLSDHRGMFIAVKGIKICKYQELLSSISGYDVLSEGDSPSHYSIILEGDFDLVTNRNALSKKAYDTLSNPDFLVEIKKFFDAQKKSDVIFSQLVARLRRESSENLLNDQIENFENARKEVKTRERFRIEDSSANKHLFLSPQAGEEYLVGVLYSQLSNVLPKKYNTNKYWKRVITFSTQGVDSLGLRSETTPNLLAEENVCAIEYKYEFNNSGPFNHALAVVDFIIAWKVDVDVEKQVSDNFTCFGAIKKITGNDFEWEINEIENIEGGRYNRTITVICLKQLIEATFATSFLSPPLN